MVSVDDKREERAERMWGPLLAASLLTALSAGLMMVGNYVDQKSGHRLLLVVVAQAVLMPFLVVFWSFLAGVRYAQRSQRLGRPTVFNRRRA